MTGSSPLRAVGVRADYARIPDAVRSWVEATLGSPVVQADTQRGGMSPGCAARLLLADGSRAFIKAVGSSLNPGTPSLFRTEIRVLAALPAVPWRAMLRASYDDGDWVAMLLDDVDGRHPNWSAAGDVRAVLAAVERQTTELSLVPFGLQLTSAGEQAERWSETLRDATPEELSALPDWLDPAAERLLELLDSLPRWLSGDTMCHWDVRNDNLLIRPDGSVVLVDWGMARLGPDWGDTAIFALEWAETRRFDDLVAAARFTRDTDGDAFTAFLLGVGAYLTVTGHRPAPPGLPTLPSFRRREGARFLAGAHRRLTA